MCLLACMSHYQRAISWPLSHQQGKDKLYLSCSFPPRDKCAHTYTHTTQVSIVKEGLWTAASPFGSRGHFCHSPYVLYIPKIRPYGKINHIPRQTEWGSRYSDEKRTNTDTQRWNEKLNEKTKYVSVSVSACIFAWEQEFGLFPWSASSSS